MVFLFQASADGILDAAAVQFCARKVSAVSGDARKALDICRWSSAAPLPELDQKTGTVQTKPKLFFSSRRAVEVVESDERKSAGSEAKGEFDPQETESLQLKS